MKILDFFRGKRAPSGPRTLRDLSEKELIAIRREIEQRALATGLPVSDFGVMVGSEDYKIFHFSERLKT